MPTIAIVDGVKIQMFYDDHAPPHFHAVLGGEEAWIVIRTLERCCMVRYHLPSCAVCGLGRGGIRASWR